MMQQPPKIPQVFFKINQKIFFFRHNVSAIYMGLCILKRLFCPVIFIIILSLITVSQPQKSFGIDLPWENRNSGLKEIEAKSLAISPVNSSIAFAGTKDAIYKTTDSGKNWQRVFRVGGQARKVNFLLFDPGNPSNIYAATDAGLFVSNNEGRNWLNIYKGIGNLESICLWFAINKDKIYLATGKGLFFSFDKGRTWQRAGGKIGLVEISCVALARDAVYLAAPDGLYKSRDSGLSWERIFTPSVAQATEATQDYDFDIDEEIKHSAIKVITIDPFEPEKIYLATANGIFFSLDSGRAWERFSSVGLIDTDIKYFFISPKSKRILCATKKGIFELRENKWQAVYQGLTASQINYICEDVNSAIWLATDRGIFKQEDKTAKTAVAYESEQVFKNFKDEPSVREIQKRAIEYAEVSPEKIKSWRRLAQVKAFMPEVSVDFDRTVTTALGSGYDRTQIGPQDWGVNLKWDVGELIWNNDQTSIDSRSKLMVELRDDILNEVTRLYFERRRLQSEVMLSPPQNKSEEIEKELRLAELTASIDALTGGYLTRMLEKNK